MCNEYDGDMFYDLEDYRKELCRQADYWGMESLTEDQQCIVNGIKIGKDGDE